MKIIGTRKMIVIITCVLSLTTIICYHCYKSIPIDASVLAGMSMITALGGVHMIKQGIIDKVKKP
jgi:hypothetical protein